MAAEGIARPRGTMATAGACGHECMRGALGNDIGIMAEHGTDEMTNGADGLEPGPHRGPIEGGPRGNYTSKQGAVPPRL